MKTSKLAQKLSWLVAAILVLLPFHAFLTVWLSSGLGHYTALRLWKEVLLAVLIAGALVIVVSDRSLLRKTLKLPVTKLIMAYATLLFAAGLIALATHNVTTKAMWYGLLVDLRFLAFFMAVIIIASQSDWLKQHWRQIILSPAIIVGAIAVVQYWFLPHDFLKHFGYGDQTIPAYETINHNNNHIRVASTLRGANPLGAYLVLPLAAVAALTFKIENRRVDGLVFGGGLALALVVSFSRSAWIGAALGVLLIGWLAINSQRARRTILGVVAFVLVLGTIAGVALRDNTSFQNAFLHTQKNSTVRQSSNEQHADAFKAAIKDIAHKPLGSGVGTAGPQSIYNNNQPRIAENYFLQLGQEAGVLALALFVAICVVVGRQLWQRRDETLALFVLGSFIGLTFINLLSHAWADDTLAYLWWGLAAIALAAPLVNNNVNGSNKK